jgi:hypothetical protein
MEKVNVVITVNHKLGYYTSKILSLSDEDFAQLKKSILDIGKGEASIFKFDMEEGETVYFNSKILVESIISLKIVE